MRRGLVAIQVARCLEGRTAVVGRAVGLDETTPAHQAERRQALAPGNRVAAEGRAALTPTLPMVPQGRSWLLWLLRTRTLSPN